MEIFKTLEFSEEWVELGVITPEKLKQFEDEWIKGEDENKEHYRWGAFMAFLKSREPLTPDIVWRLYNLGASDPDGLMGGAMMNKVLGLKECPKDLLEAALKSDQKHLQETASRRLLKMEETK